MLSSIFSFKKITPNRALLILSVGILCYLLILEFMASVGMRSASAIAKRLHNDYEQALTLRPNIADNRRTVLVVGNSLLLHSIEREKLIKGLSENYLIALWPVENTNYFDWYFGLRRLFAEGSRPALIILSLNTTQLTAASVNGESFAHYMMRLNDLPMVMRAVDLDMTTASNFFFANLSSWLGNRWGIRNWITQAWVPDASLLATALARPLLGSVKSSHIEKVELAKSRLQALQDLCKTYGAQFLFLVPPRATQDDFLEPILLSTQPLGIPILMPYSPGEMPIDRFSDGFHLNARGAEQFTDRLLSILKGLPINPQ